MKYSCDHCPYETDKKSNYLRHINRKFKCQRVCEKVEPVCEKVEPVCEKVEPVCEKVEPICEKVEPICEKVELNDNTDYDSKELQCNKCNKYFSSKRNLEHHENSCDGLSKLQCNICYKLFSSKYGKYKHKRNVLCYPPPPPPENESPDNLLIVKESEESTVQNPTTSSVITMSNSQNNSQNTTNSNNNNNTINNNIIQYNAFGDEGIEQLGKFLSGRKDDAKIIEHMRQLGKKKIYGIRDIQNDIFFNPDNPEGFSIIKPEKYGSSVRVRNSEGEFEYREFEDVRDPLLDYMEKYIEIYNKTRNKYNVKFRDPKERRILQNFFKIMNDNLEIYLGEDLKEDLNIKDNTGEEDKYKQFDRVSLDNIHVQTKKYYKCRNGEFVLKKNND
jgi:hypothetical protein